MKLSTMINYAGSPQDSANEVCELEKAGLDCVWIAEAYSFDAISTMGYLAAKTNTVEIGAGIVNVYSRTPTLVAMSFASLDSLSGGRVNCGLGASGPQVIEGFHGVPYEKPMARISEYIEVCRQTWKREKVEFSGQTVQIPLPQGMGTGLGKPLKLVNHLVRSEIPIWWASIKSKSVEATARLADGWMPIFYIPEKADLVWGNSLRAGAAKRDPSLAPLMTIAGGLTLITENQDEVEAAIDSMRPYVALYVGGMGAKGQNFYTSLMRDYGWEKESIEIQDLYLDGKKTEAAAKIPREFIAKMNFLGSKTQVSEQIAAFAASGVTHLQLGLSGDLQQKVKTLEVMKTLAN